MHAGSDVLLAVTMPLGVHIFNLTGSNNSPAASITRSTDGYIASSTFAVVPSVQHGSGIFEARVPPACQVCRVPDGHGPGSYQHNPSHGHSSMCGEGNNALSPLGRTPH